MDGRVQAALRHRPHHHDVLVGPGHDACQWRRECPRAAEKDKRREARMRFPRANRARFKPPSALAHPHPVLQQQLTHSRFTPTGSTSGG